jgi:signal recognition particle receptor subunit beta
MVFLNYATMQMTAKIVYYGPGLCGKTTNLQWIHQKTAPSSRGDMVSLETEADRTLFFDLLPLEVGFISGMRVRLQLYTVPGQVFYNTTRRMVLKGADGIVFVADSQQAALDATVESFGNLKTNMKELGMSFADIPLVFQFNKRDLRNIVPVDRLQRALNPGGGAPCFEASAVHGVGVFETLKAISRLALGSLRQKVVADGKASPVVASSPKASSPAAVTPPKRDAKRPASPPASASPGGTSAIEALLGGGASVDVEFAEEDVSQKTVRPVLTQDATNILQQLENLRLQGAPEPPSAPTRASSATAPPARGSTTTAAAAPPRSAPATPAAAPGRAAVAPPAPALGRSAPPPPAAPSRASAPASASRKPPVATPPKTLPRRDPPSPAPAPDHPLSGLGPAPAAPRILTRRAAIEVPPGLLEGATEVRIHLGVVKDGKEQLVRDVSRAPVPDQGSSAPIALHLDVEVRPKR